MKKKSSSDFAESTNNDLLRDICKSKQQLILLNVFTKSYIVCNLIQLGYHRRREIRESESIHKPVGAFGDSGDLSPIIFCRCQSEGQIPPNMNRFDPIRFENIPSGLVHQHFSGFYFFFVAQQQSTSFHLGNVCSLI